MRPNAVFCHHCGRPVAAQNKVAPDDDNITITEKTFVEPQPAEPARGDSAKNAALLETDSNGTRVETTIPKLETNVELAPASKTKPVAAPPRRRRTTRFVGETEYVWEAADAPVWRILLLAIIILAAVAALIWFGATLR